MKIENLSTAIKEIDNTLRFMASIGCHGFECSADGLETVESWKRPKVKPPETLTQIRRDLGNCRRCRLANGRRNIVYGTGNPGARLVFVGEGPGHEEDQQGEPFVGPAGQLLTKIIQAMNFTREEVYICNIVKCRPPGNRNPESDEIKACTPFLERQIAAIKPEFICALGSVSAQALLETRASISRIRGRFHTYRGVKVLPTYHPAYLLRNAEKKRDVWEDMQKLMRALNGKK